MPSSTKLCGPDYLIEFRPALDQPTLSKVGATLLSALIHIDPFSSWRMDSVKQQRHHCSHRAAVYYG
jgi:hypothetical protein